MLKIALGTTSQPKIAFLKSVLADIGIAAEIFPVSSDSGVTHQPRTEKEAKLGSVNRAKTALAQVPEADIGLGIEVGYEPIDGTLFMHGWTTIADRDGTTYSEQSSTLELPKYFHQFLHDHEDDGVGFHVQEYKEKHGDNTWKAFAEIIQYREPFIKESIRNALLRYYFRDEY